MTQQTTYGVCYVWHTVNSSILAFTNSQVVTSASFIYGYFISWNVHDDRPCKDDSKRQCESIVWFTIGCSSALLMCDSSSAAEVDTDRVDGWVCVLQDGNTNTPGKSTAFSAALHSKHTTHKCPFNKKISIKITTFKGYINFFSFCYLPPCQIQDKKIDPILWTVRAVTTKRRAELIHR